jgi:hypothetical protein
MGCEEIDRSDARSPATAIIAGMGNPVAGSMTVMLPVGWIVAGSCSVMSVLRVALWRKSLAVQDVDCGLDPRDDLSQQRLASQLPRERACCIGQSSKGLVIPNAFTVSLSQRLFYKNGGSALRGGIVERRAASRVIARVVRVGHDAPTPLIVYHKVVMGHYFPRKGGSTNRVIDTAAE